jgi:polyferredoxin
VSAAAFALAAGLLGAVNAAVARPMLLAERFLPGAGWAEVAALAVYAAAVSGVLLDPRRRARWRLRLWLAFSAVFFGQLVLGLAGVERLLMTGALHPPVPAVILAGPIYRGGGVFMLALFGATLLLAGPAWCSYLCYLGAWDGALAARRRRPTPLPAWSGRGRIALLAAVVSAACLLNVAGVGAAAAAGLALAFGAGGVATMALASRRRGTMIHCAVYCPLGLVADVLGKVSPFRIRIGDGCTECGACAAACRYGALPQAAIRRRRPGLTCSLCGDCEGACATGQIGFGLSRRPRRWVRGLFVALVSAAHATFLGVARM